jgi:hypothetical protein
MMTESYISSRETVGWLMDALDMDFDASFESERWLFSFFHLIFFSFPLLTFPPSLPSYLSSRLPTPCQRAG